MKRFSIKDLPSKYSNAEYNLKQMTTNDLKHWKEQGCLDDEETGILWIAKDNEIDYLCIGNKCPDSADDIVVTGVKLAIYFDGDDLMVKAKNDVDIEYISNAIDEILSMYDESNNTMFCGSKETDKEYFEVSTETTEKIETNSNELAKSTEIEDLPREELEDIIKEDIVKFNEFAVNKIKEYAPETQELKVYTSPTYNYRVDEIFAYSEYIQVYVAIYGIYQLAYLIQSCIDYRTTEVFNYDIDDECVYVWGGFDKEETSKTTEDTKVVDETIYEEKERFVRISLKSLLFDADKNILDVYYQHDNATNEEFVTILYANCNKDMLNEKEYERICVTGDSLIAIVNDVTKRLVV